MLYYHSVVGKAVVGIAEVVRSAYADRTATDGDWSAVDLIPKQPLPRPVTLEKIKRHPKLKEIALVRLSRLSVQPLAEAEFDEIVKLGSK